MKLSFSLKAKAAPAPPVGAAPSLRAPAAFGADDDEPAPGIAARADGAASATLRAQASRAQRKRMDAERRVDASVFEYDEVYDAMQAAKNTQAAAKAVDAQERKVRTCARALCAAPPRADIGHSPSTSAGC
jgi:coiled-coil domain-containing protein 55